MRISLLRDLKLCHKFPFDCPASIPLNNSSSAFISRVPCFSVGKYFQWPRPAGSFLCLGSHATEPGGPFYSKHCSTDPTTWASSVSEDRLDQTDPDCSIILVKSNIHYVEHLASFFSNCKTWSSLVEKYENKPIFMVWNIGQHRTGPDNTDASHS